MKLNRVGLAPKVLVTMVLAAAMVAGALTVVATARLGANLEKAFATNGEAIAIALVSVVEEQVGAGASAIQTAIDTNKVIAGVKYIYVKDGSGAVLAHTFSPSFPEGLAKVNAMTLGEELPRGQRVKVDYEVDMPVGDGRLYVVDIAAQVGAGALGEVHVGMNREVIAAQVSELRRTMFAWGGLFALIGAAFGLVVVLLIIVMPIRALTRATKAIVEQGDLAQTIKVRSNDEIGDLATNFANLVAKLREIPISLGDSIRALNDAVTNLGTAAGEQNTLISRQAAAIQQTQVTAQELRQTSEMAAQKAATVLEVTAKADEVSRTGADAIERSLGGLSDIKIQVEAIAAKIGELGERTRQINGIAESVKDLADQSNMLALNATIEAVRSGEHGKGFAVVAREIRSLADRSISSTNRIREILQDVSGAVQVTVTITDKGSQKMAAELVQVKSLGDNLRQLSVMVRDNTAAVRQIAAAVSQQDAGIAQIFTAVTDLSELMGATVKGVESTTVAVTALKAVSGQVSKIVEAYRV
jgi:methyl-accepting chemotaxis protein